MDYGSSFETLPSQLENLITLLTNIVVAIDHERSICTAH